MSPTETDPVTEYQNPPDDRLLRHFATSLRPVAEDCSKLVTQGLSLSCGSLDQPLPLAHVYVGLETKTPRPTKKGVAEPSAETRTNLSALEVLFDPGVTRVVLVGDPGSGKSTFLQYVTLCLADQLCSAAGLPSKLADYAVPELLGSQQLVPFRVILREFAPTLDPGAAATAAHVREYLARGMTDEAKRHLDLLLKRGLAFVLFDGLDEVPQRLLKTVKEAITAFPKLDYFKCRVAVTSRTRSYELAEFRLNDFPPPHEIAPLSSVLQAQFVDAWYRELEKVWSQQYRGQGAACAASLRDELAGETLNDMAGNPFFLTAMAAMHSPEKPLPDTSAELMHNLVNGVLNESRRVGATAGNRPEELEVGALLAKLSKRGKQAVEELRMALQAVAYETRVERQDRSSCFVDDKTLKVHLALGEGADPKWVGDLLNALRHRAGVLHSKDGGPLEFAYRFEEFLAGCHLANAGAWSGSESSFAARALGLFDRQGNYAREVVRWAAGMNAHVHAPSGTRGLVRELVELLVACPEAPSRQRRTLLDLLLGRGRTTAAAATNRSLEHWELAADIARDAHMEQWSEIQVPGTARTVRTLRETLEGVRDTPARFTIQARSRAASAIGRLGDPREGVGLDEDGLPLLAFEPQSRLLPAGPFLLAAHVREQATPEGKMVQIQQAAPRSIEAPYRIARFPVTVAQYRAFVAAGGYDERKAPQAPEWWGTAGWRWKTEDEINGPEEYTPEFQTPNHPRVGVSWYEATAFCQWLTETLRAAGKLPAGQVIRLPIEEEWEQAARWDPTVGRAELRTYPWGECEDEDLARYCNWDGTGLKHTSAVGLFPKGEAGCGAFDMAGNVWEWCANEHEAFPGCYVLRGGSWVLNVPVTLRAACRGDVLPGGRDLSYGFRVVVVYG